MVENIMTRMGGTGISGEELTVTPQKISLFGFEISETIIMTWAVMLILILFAVIIRIFVLKKFQIVPKGIQNILEMVVAFCEIGRASCRERVCRAV